MTAMIKGMASRKNHVGHQGFADVDFTSADACGAAVRQKKHGDWMHREIIWEIIGKYHGLMGCD